MSYVCNLFGELSNISMEDFIKLKDRFARHMHLDVFEHKEDNILVIDAGFNSRKKVSWVEKFVYHYIAESIPLGRFEKLYFKDGYFFSCIFFGHKQFEVVRYTMPEQPVWWQGDSIDYIHSLKNRIMELLRKGVVLE